jgi:hypothetical protein
VAIHLSCRCGKRLQVGEEMAGRPGRCPACGLVLQIPGVEPAAAPPRELPEPSAVTADPGLPATRGGPDGAAAPLGRPAVERVPGADARPAPDPPGYVLYSPGQVAAVAFFLGPVGAFLMLALNCFRLGKGAGVWMTLVAGLLTVVVMLLVTASLPLGVSWLLVGLPVFLALWLAASLLQGGICAAHLRAGGEQASGGAAIGVGLLGLLLYFAAICAGALTLEASSGLDPARRIDYGAGEEVYFSSGVTREEAMRVGRVLTATGFFGGPGGKTVVVARENGRLAVSLVIEPSAVNHLDTLEACRDLRRALGDEFRGPPVEVRLCDEDLRVLKVLP